MIYYDSIHSLTMFQCLRHFLGLGLGHTLIAASGIHSRVAYGSCCMPLTFLSHLLFVRVFQDSHFLYS